MARKTTWAIDELPELPSIGEEIRHLPFAPQYAVSEHCRVFSGFRGTRKDRTKRWSELDGWRDHRGYLRFCLVVNGQSESWMGHVLVLETFVGPRPGPKHEGCHLEGSPLDNHVSKLYWGTHLQNMMDRKRHGRDANRQLLDWQVLEIRQQRASGAMIAALAEKYGVSRKTISDCTTGRSYPELSGLLTIGRKGCPKKLTLEKVIEMRELWSAGSFSIQQLADRFGVG